jgi:hypothetical protein
VADAGSDLSVLRAAVNFHRKEGYCDRLISDVARTKCAAQSLPDAQRSGAPDLARRALSRVPERTRDHTSATVEPSQLSPAVTL